MVAPISILLALLFAAAPAWGHAMLTRAVPAVGGHLAVAPADLVLKFTEAVEPTFTTIDVRDPAGKKIELEKPRSIAGASDSIAVTLPGLPPGIYTVIWRVVSVDTHKTEGRYQFTIRP